ncbi:EamA family transporter [Vogesella sp. LYT5W]|uniref:EamA family transporter n=1 Tax=Vogesella margarita TaxID=2984199 RepID=A0ABT5ILV7_9NEIS|nr:EamA family transporter [Vogesella margarita]MDC7713546.1 EamA family transporter [Vogesella margarita]
MKKFTLLPALLAILLWSSLAALGAFTQRLPPFLVTAIALFIGSLLAIHRLKEWRVAPRTLLIGVAGIFGYHCLLFTAFRTAPALEANLLNYLWPLLIVVLSPLFGLGKLTGRHIVAAMVGFCGAVLIVSKGKLDFAASLPLGYLFAIAAAFTWASYSLATRKLPPFPNAAVGGFCLLSSLLAALCHWLFEPAIVPNNQEWLALLLMGIGPLGASFFLWDKAMKEGDPKQIGALSYLTPLLSTLILAISGLGELNTISWIAGALILVGATIGTLGRGR